MNLMRILEALLFAADGPLTLEQIALALPDTDLDVVDQSLRDLQERYESEERGFCLAQAAGGWQILTHPDLYSYVERFLEGKRRARLSRAALETLAVVAYRQPVTRGELEDMRGVDCGGVLHTLIERDLVTIAGRSQAIGRPLLYKTTEKFLEHFGLMSLTDLPRLEEVDVLLSADDLRSQIEGELERRYGPEFAAGTAGEEGLVSELLGNLTPDAGGLVLASGLAGGDLASGSGHSMSEAAAECGGQPDTGGNGKRGRPSRRNGEGTTAAGGNGDHAVVTLTPGATLTNPSQDLLTDTASAPERVPEE